LEGHENQCKITFILDKEMNKENGASNSILSKKRKKDIYPHWSTLNLWPNPILVIMKKHGDLINVLQNIF
jgi:hypothetical protein